MDIHTEHADDEISKLKRMIRATPTKVNLTDRIMCTIEENRNSDNGKMRKFNRYKIITTLAAPFLGISLVIGSSFISPAMAEAVKKIPGMDSIFQLAGDLGLKIADQEGLYTKVAASDTNDGVTIEATAATFDGTRVSIAIKRTGISVVDDLKSTVKNLNLSINGNDISFHSSAEDNSIGIFMPYTYDSNAMIMEFSDLKNQKGISFPKNFDAHLELVISEIKEPFKLTIPVEMNTSNNEVFKPSITKKNQDIVFKVEKIEATPITTNITTEITLLDRNGSNDLYDYGYDLFDESGKKIKVVHGNGWNASESNVVITDTRFEPFATLPKSIIIKPFKYLYENEHNKTAFLMDDIGNIKVEYIPALETVIKLQK